MTDDEVRIPKKSKVEIAKELAERGNAFNTKELLQAALLQAQAEKPGDGSEIDLKYHNLILEIQQVLSQTNGLGL